MKRILLIAGFLFALCATASPQFNGCSAGFCAPSGGASTAFSITYVSNNNSTSSLATYTFSAQTLGTAGATRIIGIGITGELGPTTSVSGVTVGGNAASHSASCATSESGGTNVDFWYYADAGAQGTSASVAVTWSTAPSRMAIAVYNILGTSAAFSTCATNSSSTSVSTLTASATIPSGGGAISTINIHTATPGTITPTNLTNDNNLVYGSTSQEAGHNSSSSGATSMGQSWAGSTADCSISNATFSP
jgi:hypothetical protein